MVNSIHNRHSSAYPQALFLETSRDSWNPGTPRMFKDLNGEEHGALKFILENLSQKSILKLLTIQGKLKEKGDRLDHLHPLAFFMGILSHNNLRDYFYELRHKDNRAWREFAGEAINSFKQEHHHGNILDEHIEAFCQRLGKDVHHIRHLMHQQYWDEFLKHI